jgi:hypothetical protein
VGGRASGGPPSLYSSSPLLLQAHAHSTPPGLYTYRPTHTLHLEAHGRRETDLVGQLDTVTVQRLQALLVQLAALGCSKDNGCGVERSPLRVVLAASSRTNNTHAHTHTPRRRVGRVRGREREIEATTRERERRRRPKGLERGSYGGYTPCERLSPLDAFQCQRPRKTRAIVWCVCQEHHHLANH